jgi:MFS family permease
LTETTSVGAGLARPSSAHPLRQRPIVALITAEVISSLGSQMTFLALPWFVLATTGSATKMGIVLAVELAPVALLGIPSGTVVARLGARRTMLIGDLARAPLMASVPILHSLGLLSFGVLLVLVALLGVFLAPYFSAQRLVLPELVGEDERVVAQANAVVEGAQRATALLGPALAGLLIAAVGATKVLYVDAATFLVSFVLLALFVPQREPLAPGDEAKGVFAGVRFILSTACSSRSPSRRSSSTASARCSSPDSRCSHTSSTTAARRWPARFSPRWAPAPCSEASRRFASFRSSIRSGSARPRSSR